VSEFSAEKFDVRLKRDLIGHPLPDISVSVDGHVDGTYGYLLCVLLPRSPNRDNVLAPQARVTIKATTAMRRPEMR
jgi:hypothetical protein